jgi:hypothetical protein
MGVARMLRMVVCDLDGTLLSADGTVSLATQRRLQALTRQGVVFVIATGRSWRTALRVQHTLGITGPIVAHNGAYAFDTASGHDIYARRVALESARAMALWASQRAIMLRCYLGCGHPVLFNFFTHEHRTRFLRPEDTARADLHHRLHIPPVEIFLFGTWEVESFLSRFGQQGPGYELVVFPHETVREVNICAPGVDKVEGVAAVARRLGIDRSEVLAIGDGLNDLRMMRWAEASVAVGTGTAEARQIATYVTDPDCPDPVVSALDWGQERLGPAPSAWADAAGR